MFQIHGERLQHELRSDECSDATVFVIPSYSGDYGFLDEPGRTQTKTPRVARDDKPLMENFLKTKSKERKTGNLQSEVTR
jgi:hypothetical protein